MARQGNLFTTSRRPIRRATCYALSRLQSTTTEAASAQTSALLQDNPPLGGGRGWARRGSPAGHLGESAAGSLAQAQRSAGQLVRRADAIVPTLKFQDADARTVDVEEHHLRLGGLEDEVAELLDLEAGLEGELELGACVRIAVRIHSKSQEKPPTAIIPRDESYQ